MTLAALRRHISSFVDVEREPKAIVGSSEGSKVATAALSRIDAFNIVSVERVAVAVVRVDLRAMSCV